MAPLEYITASNRVIDINIKIHGENKLKFKDRPKAKKHAGCNVLFSSTNANLPLKIRCAIHNKDRCAPHNRSDKLTYFTMKSNAPLFVMHWWYNIATIINVSINTDKE